MQQRDQRAYVTTATGAPGPRPSAPMQSMQTQQQTQAHEQEGHKHDAGGQAAGAVRGARHATGFRHVAMLYRGEQGFLEGTLPFLREGVARGEAALVVVSPRKIALLREALGADAARVRFEDMTTIGRNPARIIPAWSAFAREAGVEGGALRGIGEPVCAERSPAELFECHRHEALLNLAFADAARFELVCPYDVSTLDPAVVAHAHRTHQLVRDANGPTRPSFAFQGLEAAAAPVCSPLPSAPPEAQAVPILPATLTSLRAIVARRGDRARLSPARRDDVVLAVNELATNAIRHGGGAGMLRMWETAAALVCEVSDAGRIDHPLAGRELPRPGQIGRYGLWLVNQLCDLVEQRTTPDGNVVRVWMGRS